MHVQVKTPPLPLSVVTMVKQDFTDRRERRSQMISRANPPAQKGKSVSGTKIPVGGESRARLARWAWWTVSLSLLSGRDTRTSSPVDWRSKVEECT